MEPQLFVATVSEIQKNKLENRFKSRKESEVKTVERLIGIEYTRIKSRKKYLQRHLDAAVLYITHILQNV